MKNLNELMNILKKLEIFDNDEYLEKYFTFLRQCQSTPQKKPINKHHIIPKSLIYFNSSLAHIINEKTNIIELTYSNHIIAHYYLTLSCSDKNIRYKLANAFLHLCNRKYLLNNFDPEFDLSRYNEIYYQWIQYMKHREISKNNFFICQKKKVINLDTNEVFNSIKEAGIAYNVDSSEIVRVCKMKRISAKGYHWCYLEDKDFYKIKTNKTNKIKIINLDTLEIYDSITQLKLKLNVSEGKINSSCRNFKKLKNNHYVYFKDYLNNPNIKEQFKAEFQILCRETKKIYHSCKELEDDGFSATSVIKCCRGKRKHCKGFSWEYVNSTKYLNENKCSIRKSINKNQDKCKPLKCLTNGKIYKSAKEAALDLNLNRRNVSRCAKGTTKTTNGFQFEYITKNVESSPAQIKNYIKD